MTIWLMDAKEVEKIEAVLNREIDATTAEKIQAVDHFANDVVIDKSGVGVIDISGALMATPNRMLDFFGVDYTAYSDISGQLEALEGDKSVKGIQLNINSGGGTIAGMYSTMGKIADTSKPITAKTSGVLASAAYMLASQADEISANDELTMVGSVGVVTGGSVDESTKEVTNTASPKKRNDLSTEEGVKNTEAQLDDVYGIIEEKLAAGRGVDTDTIKANYGQGALMTARTALKNGMIDSIGNNKPVEKANKQELKSMDLAQLKAEHQELYNSILADGKKIGQDEYKALSEAHLTLAGASGDSERAMADIKAGNPVDATVIAHHTAQGIKKAQIAARQEEQPEDVDARVEPVIEGSEKEQDELNALSDGVEVTF